MLVRVVVKMLLILILCAISCVSHGLDQFKEDVRVYSPNEIKMFVSLDANTELSAIRASINEELGDLEKSALGQNAVIDKNIIHLRSEELNLKKDDVIYYMLLLKDGKGYHFTYGSFKFNGVYSKKKYLHRLRREVEETKPNSHSGEEDEHSSEEFNPTESRFGGHHHKHGWNRGPHFHYPQPPYDFNSYGASGFPQNGPGFPHGPGYPNHGQYKFNGFGGNTAYPMPHHNPWPHVKPPKFGFGKDCDNSGDTTPFFTMTSTLTSTSTTTVPSIDIRFRSDEESTTGPPK